MTTMEYLTSKKITPVIRIVAGSNKAEAFVTMTIEQFEEYGKHCAEKLLPTDEEIVKEANEIGEKESWPIGRQTGFVFGAKWMRNLMRKGATLDKSTNVVISESEYCDCEYPTLGKSVSCCGNCGRYFKKKGI